jgi:hypothetical protein
MPIQRYSLRDQVRAELVAWLAEGRLKTGQRLEEERLSRALGVSRTPGSSRPCPTGAFGSRPCRPAW